jgi:hypothetical protein
MKTTADFRPLALVRGQISEGLASAFLALLLATRYSYWHYKRTDPQWQLATALAGWSLTTW